MMSSHAFAKILNIFNNVAKIYSNIERIRSMMKNAIINKLNIFENSKKKFKCFNQKFNSNFKKKLQQCNIFYDKFFVTIEFDTNKSRIKI